MPAPSRYWHRCHIADGVIFPPSDADYAIYQFYAMLMPFHAISSAILIIGRYAITRHAYCSFYLRDYFH